MTGTVKGDETYRTQPLALKGQEGQAGSIITLKTGTSDFEKCFGKKLVREGGQEKCEL